MKLALLLIISLCTLASVEAHEIGPLGNALTSQPEASDEQEYSRQNPEDIIANPDCSFTNEDMRSSGSSSIEIFREKYCQKIIPEETSQIFLPDYDAPAEFINLYDAETLKSAEDSYLQEFGSTGALDPRPIFQLNREALQIWQKLLENSGNNAELARQAFANPHSLDSDLRDKIAELHRSVITLAESTQIGSDEYNNLEIRRWYEKYALWDWNKSHNASQYRPPMHPLTMQAFLNIFSLWFVAEESSFGITKWLVNAQNAKNRNRSLALFRFLGVMASSMNQPRGIWPAASASAYYYMSEKSNAMSSLKFKLSHLYKATDFSRYQQWEDQRLVQAIQFVLTEATVGWFARTGWAISGVSHDWRSIEPKMKYSRSSDQAISGFDTSFKSYYLPEIYWSQSREILLAFRQMAQDYGIDRDLVL